MRGEVVDVEAVDEVLDGDHGLVAGAAEAADADPLLLGKAEQLHPHVAGLRHHRSAAGLRPHRGAGAVEVDEGFEMPMVFGPRMRRPSCRAFATSSSWSRLPSAPVSPKPEEMSSTLRMPLSFSAGGAR